MDKKFTSAAKEWARAEYEKGAGRRPRPMADVLKPCPFCGGKAEWNEGQTSDGSPWRYLACADCEAMGPRVSEAELSKTAPDRDAYNDSIRIATWNRRAALAQAPTGERRIAQLEADKSIALAAINFALQCDEPTAFLHSWNDGSADVDDEWDDWQKFKANLVLHGRAAAQPLAPEPEAVRGGQEPVAWQEKTYRAEWITEVYAVDQYGKRLHDVAPYYEAVWPTREEADADLRRIAQPHEHVTGRWVSNRAPSSYHEAGIRYREREVALSSPAQGQREGISDREKRLEAALRLAQEWLPCVDPHLRDGDEFKRDRDFINAALASHKEGDNG